MFKGQFEVSLLALGFFMVFTITAIAFTPKQASFDNTAAPSLSCTRLAHRGRV